MDHTFDEDYWDDVWKGDRATAMAAGAVNPHLVREVDAITPGTALEAGCGAGTEAIWLARKGWLVTGVDLSPAALGIATERAEAGGVTDRTSWLRADLSHWEPAQRYDLVTTHYAHPAMPQLDFYERIADWVAPGGTLLVVGHLHDHAPEAPGRRRDPGGGHWEGHHHAPPAEATATAAGITARLDPGMWEVITAEEVHRDAPGGGAGHARLHDVVVRARRRT